MFDLHHCMSTITGNTKVEVPMKESEIREIAENSAFMHPSKFYSKPKIIPKDAKIRGETKKGLDKILEEY